MATNGRTLAAFLWGAGIVSLAATVGTDARWLAALGRTVVDAGTVPQSIPFAAAPQQTWHNVPVLAELVFYALTRGGDRALIVAQALAVGTTFVLLAGKRGRVWPLVVAAIALFPELAVVRNSMFSLPLFAAFIVLLARDAQQPSRAVWAVVPLTVLWSNLHGAVLVGLALVIVYTLVGRPGHSRPERLGLAAATTAAVFATPALWLSGSYYLQVTRGEAVVRREGLWEPLRINSAFSWLLVAGALLLLVMSAQSMLRHELVAAAGLAAATVHSERMGTWLVLLAAGAACRRRPAIAPERRTNAGPAVLTGIGIAALVVGLIRAPAGADEATAITDAIRLAHGTPILSEPDAAERIALAGGRVWISDPLEAFRPAEQDRYLDWLDGRLALQDAVEQIQVVVTHRGTHADRQLTRDDHFRLVSHAARARVFVRRG